MKKTTIPIFFTLDENYAPYLSVAIDSLIDNCSKDYNYIINVIHNGLSIDSINKIKKLETKEVSIKFVEMNNKLDMLKDKIGNKVYSNLTIYFRIFLPFMFPEYDKAIYLDSDIVIPGDISKLFSYELEDNLIGAIHDSSIQGIKEFATYISEYDGINPDLYINSGVLLMNMKELRNVEFESHFLYLLDKYQFDTVAPDQDYINTMCFGKIMYLPYEWDCMPDNTGKLMDNPMLIHYNLFFKPWHYDHIMYEEYFWKYAKRSEFYQNILNDKNNYNDEMKNKDQEGLKYMLDIALKFIDNEYTFKKVFDNNLEERI